jgi:menaquinone-dependent protoporphyrinogen oxidase
MSKVLIVYATREGQTKKVAYKIQEHIESMKHDITLFNAKDKNKPKLEDYDLLLFGGSMHAGGIEKELVSFINENKTVITNKPNSFFLVLLSAATKDPKLKEEWLLEAKNKLQEQIQVNFSHLEMIAGALMYSRYSWPMKWIMQRIAKKAGEGTDTSKDYEYTDWEQVQRYAFSAVGSL